MRATPILLVIVALTVSACTPRGVLAPVPANENPGSIHEIFVGTTRASDPRTRLFTNARGSETRFARYDVSVPPQREPGTITWPEPDGPFDPHKQFLAARALHFAAPRDFRQSLNRALKRQAPDTREAVVYVHGYNTNFAEGLYRSAQLTHDYEIPGVPVHYSWPSRANPLAYAYDRDSALIARDGLVELLRETRAAGARRVVLVAHSMGAQLTMEALRQLSIAQRGDLLDRIAGVVLLAPDIDVDLFRAQTRRIGELPQPFLIFTSQRDRALQLSARLTGRDDRLGNLNNISAVADAPVTVLEVGAFSEGVGHFTPASSAALMPILRRMDELGTALGREPTGRLGLAQGTVLSVQSATQIILSPVEALAGIGG